MGITNQWLVQNTVVIGRVKRILVEHEYKNQSDEFPGRTIQRMLDSAVIEIKRLQRDLDSANSKVNEMTAAMTQAKTDEPKKEEKAE